jgi:flavin reductase (DIM6/NTAB) family NADH-FMN oxidoreductase RutF
MHAETVFALLDREVWLVTAAAGACRGGLIATFVSQASLPAELPRVLVGLARQHHTWGLVEASGAFALHLLTERQLDRVWRFGLRSGRDGNKLEGLPVRTGTSGSPLFNDAPAWLDCRVEARLDTGDRTVYLAEVLDAQVQAAPPPLTVKRLLQLAPPDRLRELREQVVRDSAIDAAAIRDWRRHHPPAAGGSPP